MVANILASSIYCFALDWI